ncbi:MAG: c-type cytochrome [Cyclobacteriaceae bacterium]
MANDLFKLTRTAVACACIALVLFPICCLFVVNPDSFVSASKQFNSLFSKNDSKIIWTPPLISKLTESAEDQLIKYGRELIVHTSVYLGPKGKVNAISNGMNCQNCHLDAGTKIFANNFSAVASTYPKFRARSGTIETIEKRVNDCFERSLNGQALAEDTKEMRALVAYLKWIGKEVDKNVTPFGASVVDLVYLDRKADSIKGKIIYHLQCVRCHGEDGDGVMEENKSEWKYPPVFGEKSFNVGAGLYRLTRFAGYIKSNMPNDISSYEKPLLTDDEAWDVSAYVLSMSRPSKDFSKDWPNISLKPFDLPIGPYADQFSESQHKLGPFPPIIAKAKTK